VTSSSSCANAVDQLGQTVVIVTHDPVAAGFADRVVFLEDGRIVDEMVEPTAQRVVARMKLDTV
jgi:putative ABC transport system ATP-binding protein